VWGFVTKISSNGVCIYWPDDSFPSFQ